MEPSGQYLPNQFVATLLKALDGLMGTNGLRSLLNTAKLQTWIESPPPSNENQEVDFHQFAILIKSLEDLCGPKGSQSLMRPANGTVFDELWSDHPNLDFSTNPEFQDLDVKSRIDAGLQAFAKILNETSDMSAKVESKKADLEFILECCPYCSGISSDSAQCYAFYGLLERIVKHSDPQAKVEVRETSCVGTGGDSCVFHLAVQS